MDKLTSVEGAILVVLIVAAVSYLVHRVRSKKPGARPGTYPQSKRNKGNKE